jgi:hypothetical protein
MGRFERCFKGNRNRESKGKENLSIRLHAFLVLYNVTTGLPAKHIKNIMILIQEVKRNIVLRRFKRETSDSGVTTFGRRRLLAHLSIIFRKIRDLRRYQGKANSFFKTMAQIIMEYL